MGASDDATAVQGRRLLRHAVWIFFTSTFVAGGSFTLSITSGVGTESQFRTAHTGGTVHAALLFGVAGCLRLLKLDDDDTRSLVTSSAVMGWGNTLGYLIGAYLSARGLKPVTISTKPPFLLDLDGSGPLGSIARNTVPNLLFGAAILALMRFIHLVHKGTRSGDEKPE
mmetsp:Transcript_40866/g.82386  ORF Transcript_40866/g.82386 Transcript_40866/m.82386 type:complete len:169 (+) Transcript_40866:57-563(+)